MIQYHLFSNLRFQKNNNPKNIKLAIIEYVILTSLKFRKENLKPLIRYNIGLNWVTICQVSGKKVKGKNTHHKYTNGVITKFGIIETSSNDFAKNQLNNHANEKSAAVITKKSSHNNGCAIFTSVKIFATHNIIAQIIIHLTIPPKA